MLEPWARSRVRKKHGKQALRWWQWALPPADCRQTLNFPQDHWTRLAYGYALPAGFGTGVVGVCQAGGVPVLVRDRLGLASWRGEGVPGDGVFTQLHGGAWRAVVDADRADPARDGGCEGQPVRPQPGRIDHSLCRRQTSGPGGVGHLRCRSQSWLGV